MNHGPEGHRIGDLSVEPDVLIGREEPTQFRTDEANNVAQHRDENQASIESKNETGTAGGPDRPLKGVETSKPSIGCLFSIVRSERVNDGRNPHTCEYQPYAKKKRCKP